MRKDGLYKVKYNGGWVIAKWVTNQDIDSSWSCWIIDGVNPPEGSWGFIDRDFEEIEEQQLPESINDKKAPALTGAIIKI